MDSFWIREQERFQELDDLILKEPLPYIRAIFLLVNQNNELESTIKRVWTFPGETLSKEHLQEKFKIVPDRFLFQETVLFHIPVEPEDLSHFSCMTDGSSFLRKLSLDNVHLPPSLFIFHPFNTLFFLFREGPAILKKEPSITKRSVKFRPRHTRKELKFF